MAIVTLQGIVFVEILLARIIRVSHVYGWTITVFRVCRWYSPFTNRLFFIFGAPSKPARTLNGKPVKCVSSLVLPFTLVFFMAFGYQEEYCVFWLVGMSFITVWIRWSPIAIAFDGQTSTTRSRQELFTFSLVKNATPHFFFVRVLSRLASICRGFLVEHGVL